MSGLQKNLALFTMLSVAALLAGCPGAPRLSVDPVAIALGTSEETATFRISNAGGGTLSWEISFSDDWLSLPEAEGEDSGGALTGTTTTEIDSIAVRVDRQGLPAGTTGGEVTVTAGDESVVVRISVTEAAPAKLNVAPRTVSLSQSQREAIVYLSNNGLEKLDWKAAADTEAPWLAIAPPSGDVEAADDPVELTLSLIEDEFAKLPPGDYAGVITITSNGGNSTVTANVNVPPFSISAPEVDFGRQTEGDAQTLVITNNSTQALDLEISHIGVDWLTVAVPADTSTPSVTLTLLADVSSLEPGTYDTEITIVDRNADHEVVIPVQIVVTSVTVDDSDIAFGEVETTDQDTFSITNEGGGSVDFTITIEDASPPIIASERWIEVSPASGTVSGSRDVTVSVDARNQPAGLYEAAVVVSFEGYTERIDVSMAVPRPPQLEVRPAEADFGGSGRSESLMAIWNSGQGTIAWRIDTSRFPRWLELEAEDPDETPIADGIITGSVTGEETDAFVLRVRRDRAPNNGQIDFSHRLRVEATSGFEGQSYVDVSMAVPLIPSITFIADGVDDQGVDYMNLDIGEDEKTFTILNEGNGTLIWSTDVEALPKWIHSLDPAQGETEAGRERRITVTVDRSPLSYAGAQVLLYFQTNDPENPLIPLLIEIQVPKVVSITSRPATLAFGASDTSKYLEVANSGDPDTILDFRVTSSKDWVSVYPQTETSIGTSGVLKDWRPISVSIDRSRLEGQGAAARLTISAYVMENGEPVPNPEVESVEVQVNVNAANLTIETANPRTRVPSLVRWVLLMRNLQYQAIAIPQTQLEPIGDLIGIFESETELERNETNQFLTPIDRGRTTVLLLLDYSGSMYESAKTVEDAAIAGARDPLQALYDSTIPLLIDELPDNYRVGIAIFNERDAGEAPVRIIRDSLDDPIFVKDKTELLNRLDSISVVDHGATQLFPALTDGALWLAFDDLDRNLIPFDDADVRALITVTDGRMTTPPGTLTAVTDILGGLGVRPFFIGWGLGVQADPMIRITKTTGGHYYSTRGRNTEEVDAFGVPIRLPIASDLADWCSTDLFDVCDQSVPNDLRSQTIFSYVTLNEMPSVTIEGRITFDDPNDQNSDCLEEQGDISADFKRSQIDLYSIVGDVRLGQVSLRTEEGVQDDGSAEVILRGDYIPRNVNSITFQCAYITADGLDEVDPPEVVQLPVTQGGIIPTQSLTRTSWSASTRVIAANPPVRPYTIYEYTYSSDDGTPLRYGEFGDMLTFSFDNLTTDFRMALDVTDPVFGSGVPDTKYFTCPDTMLVTEEAFMATSFPSLYYGADPAIISSTDPLVLDLGTTRDSFDLRVYNLGGSHPETTVGLGWDPIILPSSGYIELSYELEPEDRRVYSTLVPATLTGSIERCLAAGDYSVDMYMIYDYGTVNVSSTTDVFSVTYTILPPDLGLSVAALTIPSADNSALFSISNLGQSQLEWTTLPGALPLGITLDSYVGNQCNDEPRDVRVYVDREEFDPADSPFDIAIVWQDEGNERTERLTITVEP